ncbi:hypothetical protein [Streptomyces ossamyceticus]|uniref:Nucleotidyltransferase-like protein n=1 Tax=Streptomyces ossamyceticus TaxID=249581 RepID=A0ABV2V3N2_9ACTN
MPTTSAGATAFPDVGTLARRLDTFLEQRGLTREAVRGEADQGVGAPLLAVAAGSVLAGFGNHRSDLDLLVLVENDRLTRFPIQSHEHGSLIDVNIRRASSVRDTTAALATHPWPRFDSVTEDAWNHRRRALNTVGRLALGLPLTAEPPWDEWHTSLHAAWLAEAIEGWWTVEAHRLALAARWLLPHRPHAAAVRTREAVTAALNARAAAAGELYFAAKWAGEKLKVLGDTEGLAVLRAALAPDLDVPRSLAAVERLVGAPEGLHAVLRWATGVTATPLDDRTVVDRWQLRTVESPGVGLPPGDGDAVVWSGPADTGPPDDLLRLFVHNLLWCALAHPDPEVPA